MRIGYDNVENLQEVFDLHYDEISDDATESVLRLDGSGDNYEITLTIADHIVVRQELDHYADDVDVLDAYVTVVNMYYDKSLSDVVGNFMANRALLEWQ